MMTRPACATLLTAAAALFCSATAAAAGKQVEKLDRGVVAIASNAGGSGTGNFISWRALATDPAGLAFNVYRDGARLNAAPLAVTNYSDPAGTPAARYSIKPVLAGAEQATATAGRTWNRPYLSIPVQKPADGVTPDGKTYSYEINDGSAADLDGDGSYELIIKWQPTNAHDNSQAGYTGDTYVDAYKMDGTRLWRIDLGCNIRAGAHYTTFLAYDFDGDGKAEVMMKTADGSIDGKGQVIGDERADYRNERGYILDGPEFLTVFNGLTGAAMASTAYLPARGSVAAWGDAYGNRVDRFLGGVAYLDGARPSAIFSRGYYTRAVVAAWDWRDGKLASRWVYDSDQDPAGNGASVYHQGAHWLSVADVDGDGDGKDDIIYGAATIGSNGRMLYSTGLCHGDALHVGKLDPNRPGQQIYMVHETPSCYGDNGLEMHDAATGKILWHVDGKGGDIRRGVCMDIDPAYHPLLNGRQYGAASNNGTKSTPVLSADLFGDWPRDADADAQSAVPGSGGRAKCRIQSAAAPQLLPGRRHEDCHAGLPGVHPYAMKAHGLLTT